MRGRLHHVMLDCPGGAVLGGGEALSSGGGLCGEVGVVFGQVAVAAVGVPGGLVLRSVAEVCW